MCLQWGTSLQKQPRIRSVEFLLFLWWECLNWRVLEVGIHHCSPSFRVEELQHVWSFLGNDWVVGNVKLLDELICQLSQEGADWKIYDNLMKVKSDGMGVKTLGEVFHWGLQFLFHTILHLFLSISIIFWSLVSQVPVGRFWILLAFAFLRRGSRPRLRGNCSCLGQGWQLYRVTICVDLWLSQVAVRPQLQLQTEEHHQSQLLKQVCQVILFLQLGKSPLRRRNVQTFWRLP